jgi:hypothetical protein
METMETVVRAFELPVHRVEAEGRDGWVLIRECWRQATDLANWGVQTLLRADCVRLPGMDKLPPPPRVNGKRLKGLYGKASEDFDFKGQRGPSFWAGACISASSILKAVEDKYVAERLNVLWHRRQAPANYRYPHPWPVHSQAWKDAGFDAGGRPYVTCALPGGTATLRLRGGPEFGRQLSLFRQVVDGNLPKLQLVIRQQGASLSCHRPTMKDRGCACRVLVKIVARLPVTHRQGGRCLVLLTDPNSLWVAELDGRPAWVLNADHVRRAFNWLASWESRRQRLAQDRKAERRLKVGRLDQLNREGERCREKHRKRLHSWLHETAAHLAGFADRQKVGEVFYLDRDRGFMPAFPWSQLHALLADKIKALGINFYSESGAEGRTVPADEPEPDKGKGGAMCPTPDLQPSQEDDKWLRVTRLREMAARKLLAARRRSGSHRVVSTP